MHRFLLAPKARVFEKVSMLFTSLPSKVRTGRRTPLASPHHPTHQNLTSPLFFANQFDFARLSMDPFEKKKQP
jgi:hypothetical protein